jgi:hypothetical protein
MPRHLPLVLYVRRLPFAGCGVGWPTDGAVLGLADILRFSPVIPCIARDAKQGLVFSSLYFIAQRAFAALRADSRRCFAVSFRAVAWPPIRAISAMVIGRFFCSLFAIIRSTLPQIRTCVQWVQWVSRGKKGVSWATVRRMCHDLTLLRVC